jgi:tetratricopeptide (TPR) repeat protein
MRRAIAAFLLLALPGVTGCAAPRPPDASSPTTPVPAAKLPGAGGVPTWLPAYTAQQQALLAPVDHPIQTPAQRVFPDLERFWYANNRRLDEPEDAFKFTRMVATILSDSPRFYELAAASGDVENAAAQYGPPAVEPDGWSFARRGPNGVAELKPAPGAAEARVDFDRGAALAARGEAAPAVAAFRAAAIKSPRAPAIHVALAAALVKSGKLDEAERAYNEAIGADPTFAPAYTALAEIIERRGDVATARKVVTEALAYQPDSRRALTMAQRLGGGGRRIAPFAIFLDVDSVGAIHVTTAEGNPAQMYGGCRAVMRYEPEVRAQIFEQPAETPYYLSVVEEVICLEAALGAYMVDQRDKGQNAPDERLDRLLALAHEEGLSGYVMFEILGKHRPERARVAPPDVHRAMVRYVERDVFGQKPAPTGVYTVDREKTDDERELDEAIETKVREAARQAARDIARELERRLGRRIRSSRPMDDSE